MQWGEKILTNTHNFEEKLNKKQFIRKWKEFKRKNRDKKQDVNNCYDANNSECKEDNCKNDDNSDNSDNDDDTNDKI